MLLFAAFVFGQTLCVGSCLDNKAKQLNLTLASFLWKCFHKVYCPVPPALSKNTDVP